MNAKRGKERKEERGRVCVIDWPAERRTVTLGKGWFNWLDRRNATHSLTGREANMAWHHRHPMHHRHWYKRILSRNVSILSWKECKFVCAVKIKNDASKYGMLLKNPNTKNGCCSRLLLGKTPTRVPNRCRHLHKHDTITAAVTATRPHAITQWSSNKRLPTHTVTNLKIRLTVKGNESRTRANAKHEKQLPLCNVNIDSHRHTHTFGCVAESRE